MYSSGFRLSVSGCDSIIKKKLQLYGDKYPSVQLFFTPRPSRDFDVCVISGFEVIEVFENRKTKMEYFPPIIAFGPVEVMPAAIAAGCSDFLCEPWSTVELFERARRCLGDSAVYAGNLCIVSGVEGQLSVYDADGGLHKMRLPMREYEIYRLFAGNRGEYFDRESIIRLLTPPDSTVELQGSRAADMHISRLRRRINRLLVEAGGNAADNPVITVSGHGWGIVSQA
ncbi:MAG: winged helix-turn-helix domain-containing protein [Spirochaetales bacterium]|uniref:Winged helix-turn-helix domain-containing protein n=1 Tax=Candidatus Thalassospirochaeta sargassi TaxID=3119039 RepID=A0AAJ1IE38_9SPIO|nr:winged helix-turn-helix domain-containing protein [Spirochaetales bacterium]